MSFQESKEMYNPINEDIEEDTPEQAENKKRKVAGIVTLSLMTIVLLISLFESSIISDSISYTGDCYTGCCTWEGMDFCPGDCITQGYDDEYYCPASVEERVMKIYDITSEDAICNDGTQGRLHYRPSLPGDNENKWLFRFEGGNLCFDTNTCDQRADDDPAFMTAATSPIIYQDPEGGMFDGNPDEEEGNYYYHDWNAVHTHYCTSDAWSGTSFADDNEVGINFVGYHHVFGSFEEALLRFNLAEATEVTINGYSAGCFGTIMMSDQIFEWFNTNLPGVPVHFKCDSGWFLASADYLGDMDGSSQSMTELAEQMKIAWENWKPMVSDTCLNAVGDYTCTIPEYNWEYLANTDNIFLQENTFDSMQQSLHLGNGEFTEAETDEYFEYLANQTITSLLTHGVNFQSSNCGNHDSTNRQWMYEITVDNMLLHERYENFRNGERLIQDYDEWIDYDEDGNKVLLKDANPTCPITVPPPHID